MIALLDRGFAAGLMVRTALQAVALRWQAGEYGKRSAARIVVEAPEPDIAVDPAAPQHLIASARRISGSASARRLVE